MNRRTKLELTWIGKDQEPQLEPRILIEDPELSYHAPFRMSENDIFDNRLIFGDNLLALKALEQEFTGKIKCIFIDPPYNTGNAFDQYDDGLEHSIWLSLMRDRLIILHRLLSEDGSLWMTLDDNEMYYCKILLDEVFGRNNFMGNVIWQHSIQGKGYSGKFSVHHNYILCYRKTDKFRLGDLERTDEHNKAYSNPDNDPKGPWRSGDVRNSLYRPNLIFDIITPSGKVIKPPKNGWRWSKETIQEKIATGEIVFSKEEDRIIRKIYLKDQEGRVPETIWFGKEVGTTREANSEIKELFGENVFPTPKPEKLLKRIIHLSTKPGDIVLDSFAGSGTTGAVAHKMGRKWIMVELGEHCHSVIIPRMKKVIEGTDQGGISKEVNWKGGGGFRYYRLAPSLLEKDKFGNWVISKQYNAAMLAEAMCKQMGFTYCPDEHVYWKQGKSTERDYIYTTTQLVTREIADQIQTQMAEGETLLICCKAYTVNPDDYPNITFVKIPQAVLKKCEFGRDDYSLSISQLPPKETVEQIELFGEEDGQ